ncbi:MAG TPA: hypothetical protein H9680_04930 [Firmicutes bacterium]|nr:hypothetical protein [Bacillota bacterium]
MMKNNMEYYTTHPQLRSYFISLPGYIQRHIASSYGQISTLGELQYCANYLLNL